MNDLLTVFVYAVLMLAASIYLHELGHYIIARYLNLKPHAIKIKPKQSRISELNWFGCPDLAITYNETSDLNNFLVLLGGVILGLLPILIGILGNLFWLIAILPYFYGCQHDLEKMMNLLPEVW